LVWKPEKMLAQAGWLEIQTAPTPTALAVIANNLQQLPHLWREAEAGNFSPSSAF
jgi:hypothetical protein